MITHDTVLVLGAGASKPYGFPIGRELLFKIKQALMNRSPDKRHLWGKLRTLGMDEGVISEFLSALIYADPPSVDTLLEKRREFLTVGKLSIALSLIPYEHENYLFNVGKSDDMPASWYRYLMDKLGAENCEEFKNNKLSIITFNYDRSLEHYLYTALKNRYGINDKDCFECFSSIPIIHVHGSLGQLPWQRGNYCRPYENDLPLQEIALASTQIIVMSEKDDNAPIFLRAYELMNKASKIFFLGFGYHDTNLRRLGLGRLLDKTNKYGTSYGLGDADWRSISDSWRITFKGANIDILGLFHNHEPL